MRDDSYSYVDPPGVNAAAEKMHGIIAAYEEECSRAQNFVAGFGDYWGGQQPGQDFVKNCKPTQDAVLNPQPLANVCHTFFDDVIASARATTRTDAGSAAEFVPASPSWHNGD